MPHKTRSGSKILKIGHRGSSGSAPENSMRSFRKAIASGVDYIECDVRLTRDKLPVILHDATLDRTTTGSGKVSEITRDQLAMIRIKGTNEPIPTLTKLFKELRGKTKFNLEVKSKNAMDKVCAMVNRYDLADDVVISSKSVDTLMRTRVLCPAIKTALIYNTCRSMLFGYCYVVISMVFFPVTKYIITRRARRADVDFIHLVYPFATRGEVGQLHRSGYRVCVWTVNDPATIARMKRNGVDGILSDHPERL